MLQDNMTFQVLDAKLLFLNFAGREGMYNKAGDRNFCVVLDEKSAKDMAADGWNVKFPEPRDDEEVRDPYIQVTVKYKIRPPKIVLITNEGQTRTYVTEDMVEILDGMDFKNVDLIANAYHWEAAGKTGIAAYLKKAYFTLDEDDLDRKYESAVAEQ